MYCKKCGSEIPDDVKFCVKCGNPTAGQAQNVQASPGQGTVIVQAGGGTFQKIMLVLICAVFLVIMFIAVSFYMDNKNEKELIYEQNKAAAQEQKNQAKAQEEYRIKMSNYESHRGSWKVDRALIDGEWQDYNFWGEAIGGLMDFRNLYSFGNDTNYGAATTIECGADSIDMSSIGFGIYSLDSFSYESTSYEGYIYTNYDQGIRISFYDRTDPSSMSVLHIIG